MTHLSYSPDLSLKVGETHFSDTEIAAALALCGDAFDKDAFDAALTQACGRTLPARVGGRVLQGLKRKGAIAFDSASDLWRRRDAGSTTLPLMMPAQGADLPVPPTAEALRLDGFLNASRISLSALACLGLIGALITLNASFAWELGREADQFRAAFVIGLMALDLMRPFLVAAGFNLLARRRFGKALLGFAVAFMLSPVSILSSTAILSSSFLLGAEMNADEAVQTATLETLRAEHTRRLAEAERLQDNWQMECARGGCGPLAAQIEAQFLTAQEEAQTVLARIVTLTEASSGASDLLARLVVTFERLGLFGQGREILLPLFLALSLELGALFGPALLLARRI